MSGRKFLVDQLKYSFSVSVILSLVLLFLSFAFLLKLIVGNSLNSTSMQLFFICFFSENEESISSLLFLFPTTELVSLDETTHRQNRHFRYFVGK